MRLLKWLGLWTNKDSSRQQIMFSNIAIIFHIFFVDLQIILAIIIYITKVTDFEDFSDAIALLPTLIGLCSRTVNFVYKRSKIENLLTSIQELVEGESWMNKTKGHKLEKRIQQIHKIYKIVLAMFIFSHLLSFLSPVVNHTLPIKMWLPYSIDNELKFWLTLVYQQTLRTIFIPVIIVMDVFPSLLKIFAAGLIEELSDQLEGLANTKPSEGSNQIQSEQNVVKELITCIKNHLRIKKIIAEIEEVFVRIFMVQGLMSIVILCMTTLTLTFVSFKHL